MHFLVEVDSPIDGKKHTSEASDMLLRKEDPIDGAKEKNDRLCTDNGWGGTKEGLVKETSLVDCAMYLMDFVITTCEQYGMSRMMKSPCENYFSDRGLLNRNLIHLLLTCWSTQDKCEMSEWRVMWEHSNETLFGDKI